MLKLMKISPNDNYSSLKPYSFVAFIYGLKAVEKKAGTYTLSHYRYVFCSINLVVFILSLLWQKFEYKEETSVSQVYEYCFNFFYIGINIRLVLIYILAFKYGKKEIDLYKSLDNIDALLRKMDPTIRFDFKSIFYKSMFIVIFAISTEATTEIFIYVVSYKEMNIYVLICHLLPLFIGDLSKCYFYLWTCIIKARFAIINNQMLKIKRQTRRSFLSVFKFEKDLTFLMDMHKKLTETARDLNGIFQVDMVLHFLLNFLVGFANAYYCVFMVSKQRGVNAIFWFTYCKYFVFVWFEYFVLIRSCKQLCGEAENTKVILCNTNIDVNDDISHRLAIASIYELNENKLVITVCQLFDVDYSTIFVMYATIANYVFIMLQFE